MSTVAKVLIAWLNLSMLRNHEHFQAHTEVALLLESFIPAALHIPDDLPALHRAQLATLDDAVKKIVKSQNTALLHEADRRRDDAYRALVFFIKAKCLSHDTVIRTKAEKIMIVIDTYKNVVSMSYEEETSAIYNLVQDLKSAKYAQEVLDIGLKPFLDTLEIDNNNVSGLVTARDNEAAAKSHVKVVDARAEIDDTYKTIVSYVNLYAKKNTAPAVEDFITKLNLIVKRFNTLVKQRQAHHHSHGAAAEGSGAEEGAGSEEGNEAGA